MPPFRIREEVLNVYLADILSDRGLLSIPETIRRSVTGRQRRLPDVTVADLRGVRIVIEGRINSGPQARESLFNDAFRRVEEGISPICLAVLYPPTLRRIDAPSKLRRSLERATLLVRVISEGSTGDWAETTVDGLTDTLRRSYELLISEDVVVSAVEDLGNAIDAASEQIASSSATPARLRSLLGIPEETGAANIEDTEDEG
jgi:hypothetical protein